MNTRMVDNQIKAQVAKIVQEEHLELVECKILGSRGKLTVRCLADCPQGGITLDECSRLNRLIFAKIQELFPGLDCGVEVNSPGLDRPLKEERDFLKAKGKTVLLWLKEPVSGKQFIEAKLEDVKSAKLFLSSKKGKISLSISNIQLGKQKFRD